MCKGCEAVQIKLMGTREHAAEKDFSGIPLEEEVEESLKESAVISMGTEISEMDLANIVALCDQVIRCCFTQLHAMHFLAHMANATVKNKLPIPAKPQRPLETSPQHHIL